MFLFHLAMAPNVAIGQARGPAALQLCLVISARHADIATLSRRDNADFRTCVQIESESAWAEEIFGEIEAAFLLNRILKVAIPKAVYVDLGIIVCKIQRR